MLSYRVAHLENRPADAAARKIEKWKGSPDG